MLLCICLTYCCFMPILFMQTVCFIRAMSRWGMAAVSLVIRFCAIYSLLVLTLFLKLYLFHWLLTTAGHYVCAWQWTALIFYTWCLLSGESDRAAVKFPGCLLHTGQPCHLEDTDLPTCCKTSSWRTVQAIQIAHCSQVICKEFHPSVIPASTSIHIHYQIHNLSFH